MTDSEKVCLLRRMIYDFWNSHDDGACVDAMEVMLDAISTVLEFKRGDAENHD